MDDSAGSLTSAPGEVIAGNNSIKGSGSSQFFLYTNHRVVQFAANHTYTITLSYRIIAAASSFGYAINSSTAITTAKDFGSSDVITGPSGSSGTATSTFSLHNYTDYQLGFNINGTGTIIIESSGRTRDATNDFFPTGSPTTMSTPMILFADINGDGLPDIVFAEAGLDRAPWTGARLGVALNMGGGTYRDVSSLIPADQLTDRAYATAVGDVLGDGKVEIILPDENDGRNTALLRWNGNGFDEIRNWIPQSIWTNGPASLHAHSWMTLADLDQDGKQDLLVTGQDHNPNFQIVFGGAGGFTAGTLVTLPDGPFGHNSNPGAPLPPVFSTTGEVSPVVAADFNNDGRPDIFAIIREVTIYQPGAYTDTSDPLYPVIFANGGYVVGDSTFQVLLNQGQRSFLNVTLSAPLDLGKREYQNLIAIDLNNDGFLDVVGTYVPDMPGLGPQYGTTLFLSDGTGAFQVVDGADLLVAATTTPSDGRRWNLGAFVPTVVNRQRTEGIVYESVGGSPKWLNIYKVVANTSIGTGPNFVDPATLGVPGFNEFFYLRHYPAAAAAVQAGQYASGLAHYLAAGGALGYQPHAPAGISPLPTLAPIANAATRRNGRLTLNLAVGDAVGGPAGVSLAAASSNPTLLPPGAIGVSGSGSTRTLTIVPAPNQIGTATITVFGSARGLTTSMSFVLTVYVPGPADYDGDRKTDIGIYRPATGIWYILPSTTNYTSYASYQWGVSTDVPLTGDYDGDGKADVAVYRPATGIWYILLSTTNFASYVAYQWGVSTDTPVPGDYDGDGKTDVAIYRPTTGVWYVLLSTTNAASYVAYQWGVSTDPPVPGDYDGDGKTDVAIYRPATGIWYVLRSSTNSTSYVAYQWGVSTDRPVAGDYDGDGKADVAVYRPATGVWYVLRSSTNSTAYVAYQWGASADIPVPADYDGDGQADVAVYRPATGIWYVLRSSTNSTAYVAYQWGVSTDVPLGRP